MPLFLQYPVPYTQDTPTPLLVSQSPSKLHFGNPYSILDSKGEPKATRAALTVVYESVAPNPSPCRRDGRGVLQRAAQAPTRGPSLLGQQRGVHPTHPQPQPA